MLKWTTLARKDSQIQKTGAPLPTHNIFNGDAHTPRQKAKRRRSSTSRKTPTKKRCSLDALEADKENQFHSTPIKNSSSDAFSPFKDVSNLTPSEITCRRVSLPLLNDRKCSPKFRVKKKKDCLEIHNKPKISDDSNYFKHFEAVDSHIESILADDLCSCKKNPIGDAVTPKIISYGVAETPKVQTIDDLVATTDETKLPGFKPSIKTYLKEEARVSPLVKKFLDIKFSRVSLDDADNSSIINDLSLDQLVDVLMESSKESSRASLNTSVVVNVENEELEKENEHNETKEENMMNWEQERQLELHSEASSDSGFKSSGTENSHQIDSNFLCKCNNNNNSSSFDKTIIQINETYNERCVDGELRRKRSSISSDEFECSKRIKIDEDCTLRRQRCVRKRKADNLLNRLSKVNGSVASNTVSPLWAAHQNFLTPSDEESFSFPVNVGTSQIENTPLRGCYLENKNIPRTPSGDVNRTIIKKCIVFDSLRSNDSSSFADSTFRCSDVDARGSVDLRIFCGGDYLFINVIRCQDLYRPDGENINAYIKVAISDRLEGIRRKKNAVLQRTPVQNNSSRPTFNHTFKFAKPPADSQKRIRIEVWHRDRTAKTSEFLGCLSFDIKDVLNKIIDGSFYLLSHTEGRIGNAPIANEVHEADLQVTGHQVSNMGENTQEGCGSVTEEILSLDGVEAELKRSTNKSILSEQQKYADENLFLRYLELDPTEGPDAIPAALQRKATGNKFGRTPFTQTKRLVRPAKSGFGFSVVWTHPPRIERVEKGLPADRVGVLPGDYIIFVDKHNVVMMPEIDILNLIRSYGSQLTLEIFRRNPSRNGSVPSVHYKSTTMVTPSSIRTDSNVNLPSTASTAIMRRPSTVCSTNTVSVDYRRRKLNLPQVTFSSEVGDGLIV